MGTNFEIARKNELLKERAVRSTKRLFEQEEALRQNEAFDVTIQVWENPKGENFFQIEAFSFLFFVLFCEQIELSLKIMNIILRERRNMQQTNSMNIQIKKKKKKSFLSNQKKSKLFFFFF